MKITLILTLIIVLLALGLNYAYKDDYVKRAENCVDYFGDDHTQNDKILYWEKDGYCCKYTLIDNNITELCKKWK